MNRMSITKKMIRYLEDRVNCENAIKFADIHALKDDAKLKISELTLNSTNVAYEIVYYNDNIDKVDIMDDTDKKNRGKTWLENMFYIFDFISEANYVGYEYFPHLYGVLNCHNGENSCVYLYYELFEGNLEDLINSIGHSSEWYDIVFQMIMINHYLQVVNKCSYDGFPKNHLYRKLAKPYYKKYEIDGKELNINHKFLIVLKDFNHINQIMENNTKNLTNIDLLLEHIAANKDQIKILPSNKIMNLMRDVASNPEISMPLLFQYYAQIPQK